MKFCHMLAVFVMNFILLKKEIARYVYIITCLYNKPEIIVTSQNYGLVILFIFQIIYCKLKTLSIGRKIMVFIAKCLYHTQL